MQKVLCTGSAGFIFSNFIRKSIYDKQPYEFVSVDKVTKGSVLNNIYLNKSHKFHIGDVSDAHFIDVIFELERPDIVIHGAAETHVDDSIRDPNKFIQSNILGTQVLVNASIKWGVKKFVYISTDEVYGQLNNESESSWTEESVLSPRNPYAASKAAGELLVKAAHITHGLSYNITRSSNNYGPRQSPDKFIPKIIKCILNEQKIPVYGQGLQIRDWTYVMDNCEAILTILNSGKENNVYNISANQEYTNIEVVQLICNAMEKGHSLIEFVNDRKGHDFRYSLNCNKLKQLGWEPKFKFKEGIHATLNWYLNNKWFIK